MFPIKTQFIRDESVGVALCFQVTTMSSHSYWVLDVWLPGIPGGISRVMHGLGGVPVVERLDLAELASKNGFNVPACYLSVDATSDDESCWYLAVSSAMIRFGGKAYLFDRSGRFVRADHFSHPKWREIFGSDDYIVIG